MLLFSMIGKEEEGRCYQSKNSCSAVEVVDGSEYCVSYN
jgi:hypothetical protein